MSGVRGVGPLEGDVARNARRRANSNAIPAFRRRDRHSRHRVRPPRRRRPEVDTRVRAVAEDGEGGRLEAPRVDDEDAERAGPVVLQGHS